MNNYLYGLNNTLIMRGITQAELATMIGDTTSHVSMVMHGKTVCRLEWVRKVVRALNLDEDEAFDIFFAE